MSGDEIMYTPDEQAAWLVGHDHKGHSEEKCVRCGWVMGHQPLNCNNDDTPHVFPSQLAEVERLRDAGDALAVRHRKTFFLDGAFDTELRQWEAARRG